MLSFPTAHEEPFRGPGEIRGLLRAADWSKTPLGPVASWPKSLIGFVHMILEMPTPAIVFWGPEQTQLYNEGYAAIMGPRHPRYFGAPYAECWPDTYAAIMPSMREVLRGGVAQFDETLFTMTRYGFTEEAYFTFTFSPLRDDGGDIAGVFQPVVEVTDRVLAERRAKTLQALAQQPQAAETVAALAADREDVPFAAVLFWNEVEDRLEVAAASAALEGRDCSELYAAAREAFKAGACRRVDDFGFAPPSSWGDPTRSAFIVPLRQSKRGVLVLGISPRLHFDDAYQRFLESAAAAFDDAGERALLVASELTARREADLQKEHLSALFMQAPMPVCVLRGPQHVIELANPRICQIWQRPHDEVIERPLFEALPELAGQVFKGLLDGVLRTGEAYVGKELVARFHAPNDAAPRDVYFNFVYEPLRDLEGKTMGVLVVAFDVTDEVRARQKMTEMRDAAERDSRLKDEFLAMLGHELRNPLAPLLTSVALIRKRLPSPSPIDRHVDVIERQGSNLHRIVNDLLEVARVTQGKIELRTERVDLVSLVDCGLESTRGYLESRRHEVTISRPLGPTIVLADPVRIEQVVVNLLTNAAKYTNAGGRISVTVEPVGDKVELRVKDNGIGIPEDLQPRLFELFQQGGRDSARAQGGLGIGLTIVRRLVALHGGTVEARSEGAGRGSEFVVTLPLAERDAQPEPAPTSDRRPATVPGARKVLVVDDNHDAAEALAEAIESMGHQPRTAFDGPSALAASAEWQPDVIFLDIGLPGMDGYEVAREITRRAGPRPTLVALTGYGQAADRAKARDAGFDEHLVKPAQLGAIANVLERFRTSEVRSVTE